LLARSAVSTLLTLAVLRELLHLSLQLFRLAPQHLCCHRPGALLRIRFWLANSSCRLQCVEFRNASSTFFACCSARRCSLARLVLVLSVSNSRSKRLARSRPALFAAATSAAALLAEGNRIFRKVASARSSACSAFCF